MQHPTESKKFCEELTKYQPWKPKVKKKKTWLKGSGNSTWVSMLWRQSEWETNRFRRSRERSERLLGEEFNAGIKAEREVEKSIVAALLKVWDHCPRCCSSSLTSHKHININIKIISCFFYYVLVVFNTRMCNVFSSMWNKRNKETEREREKIVDSNSCVT